MIPIINKQCTAQKIKSFMVRNNLKPTDIQSYLNLTCVQTVYRWLEGVNIPTIDHLYALSQLFKVKIDDLIVGSRSNSSSIRADGLKHRLVAYYDSQHGTAA